MVKFFGITSSCFSGSIFLLPLIFSVTILIASNLVKLGCLPSNSSTLPSTH